MIRHENMQENATHNEENKSIETDHFYWTLDIVNFTLLDIRYFSHTIFSTFVLGDSHATEKQLETFESYI